MFILSLQHYLSTTSSQLFTLTSSRGRFASATVVLPSSWAGTECVNSHNDNNGSNGNGSNVTVSPTLYPEDFEPDFSVEPPHPIFGAEPRALHSGRCGSAGRGVSLPYTAVLEEDEIARQRIGESMNPVSLHVSKDGNGPKDLWRCKKKRVLCDCDE